MSCVHDGKQDIVLAVTHGGANAGGELITYALPWRARGWADQQPGWRSFARPSIRLDGFHCGHTADITLCTSNGSKR
jgi:hypothetical protein